MGLQEQRYDSAPAKDSSLIPTGEVDLVPLAITAGADAMVDLASAGSFQQPLAGVPLILLVSCDQDFCEGQAAAATPANNLRRAGGQIHVLSVNGRSSWHFRAISTNGTITGKLLTAG